MKTAATLNFKNNRICKIKISEISENEFQPRKYFSENAIESLAESIKQNGLISPLTVRKAKKGYMLVAGERRLRALKLLGRQYAPCIVLDIEDKASATLAIIENLQREDLNPFEQAEAIYTLISKWGLTQSEAAEKLSLSQSAVANKLRLLRLSQEERAVILKNSLTERHARALLSIKETEARRAALNYIVRHKLNVEKSEKYIENLLRKPKGGDTKMVFKDLRIFINTIHMAVETMRKSGVMASATKGESEGFIEYTIRIPKPASTD